MNHNGKRDNTDNQELNKTKWTNIRERLKDMRREWETQPDTESTVIYVDFERGNIKKVLVYDKIKGEFV